MPGYDDIIHLPHHVSTKRSQMSMHDRASQFSPFAALTGYDDAIRETGRLTNTKIEITEEDMTVLNLKYQILVDRLEENYEVTFTYFVPDKLKSGGTYVSKQGVVKKVDEYERLIILYDGTTIPMDDVLDCVVNKSMI